MKDNPSILKAGVAIALILMVSLLIVIEARVLPGAFYSDLYWYAYSILIPSTPEEDIEPIVVESLGELVNLLKTGFGELDRGIVHMVIINFSSMGILSQLDLDVNYALSQKCDVPFVHVVAYINSQWDLVVVAVNASSSCKVATVYTHDDPVVLDAALNLAYYLVSGLSPVEGSSRSVGYVWIDDMDPAYAYITISQERVGPEYFETDILVGYGYARLGGLNQRVVYPGVAMLVDRGSIAVISRGDVGDWGFGGRGLLFIDTSDPASNLVSGLCISVQPILFRVVLECSMYAKVISRVIEGITFYGFIVDIDIGKFGGSLEVFIGDVSG